MKNVVIHRQCNKHISIEQPSHATLLKLSFNTRHVFRCDRKPPLGHGKFARRVSGGMHCGSIVFDGDLYPGGQMSHQYLLFLER